MKKLITLTMAVGLASCATPPEETPKPQIPTHRLISQNNRSYGWETSKNEKDAIRDEELIKGYAIKGYVDPNNPNVRMPGGTMHVITRPSKWNTEPLTRNGIVVEPQYAAMNKDVPSQVDQSRLASLEKTAKANNRMAKDAALTSRATQRELEDKVEVLEAKIKQLGK